MRDKTPICVDLDGTLIHTDLLVETFLLLIKQNPLNVFRVIWWLFSGKAHLKARIADHVTFNPEALPYNKALTTWLQDEKAAGRPLWLATASDRRLAQAVADHTGLFEGVLASDGQYNMAGRQKAHALVARFGDNGFDYCGNSSVDLHVWAHARRAVVVSSSTALKTKAQSLCEVAATFETPRAGLKVITKALRVHQWAKNVLVFVPLLAAHRFAGSDLLLGLGAFMAFSLCASSVYLLNDMLDLEADRQHKTKCHRPFAAGSLSPMFGLFAAPVLLVAAALVCLALEPKFAWVLLAYYAFTVAYSFDLKRRVMVDVLSLAGLYTIRIVAGAAALAIPLSFWLLLFAIFLFLSLALIKRYAELDALRRQGKIKAMGRGYQVEDLAMLQSLGAASGYLSVLVMALYFNSPDVSRMYAAPKFLWGLMPVILYWISRMWMLTHRGYMNDDPLVFAFKDRMSQLTGLLAGLILAMGMWGAY